MTERSGLASYTLTPPWTHRLAVAVLFHSWALSVPLGLLAAVLCCGLRSPSPPAGCGLWQALAWVCWRAPPACLQGSGARGLCPVLSRLVWFALVLSRRALWCFGLIWRRWRAFARMKAFWIHLGCEGTTVFGLCFSWAPAGTAGGTWRPRDLSAVPHSYCEFCFSFIC